MHAGLYGYEITRGTLVGGRRVAEMRRGVRDHRQVVSLFFEERDRRGRKRLGEPVTYPLASRVPGTARPTTWAMPAGPVGRTPGTKLNGGWYGDRDDTGRASAADRHQRRIESITYA